MKARGTIYLKAPGESAALCMDICKKTNQFLQSAGFEDVNIKVVLH